MLAPSQPVTLADVAQQTLGARRYVSKGPDIFAPCGETVDRLPSGFYTAFPTPAGVHMLRRQVNTDDLLGLPDPVADMLMREFTGFWKAAPKMVERGLSVKRGIFLHGRPGGGKTSSIMRMAHHMVREMDGLVMIVHDVQISAAAMSAIRQVEPSRPMVAIYEDIDAIICSNGESSVLAALDGELQVNNIVNVATCNYPELLDPRLVNRPGRFDRIVEVGMPREEARRAYLKLRAPELDPERVERWVAASEGWSIAHMRELVVATLVLEEPDDAVIQRLQDMHDEKPSSENHDRPDAVQMGFSARERQKMLRGVYGR